MPWKQGYTISDERSLADSEIRWPDGARCCVAVTVDLSVASGAEGVTAADLATPEALFGANQGLSALREILRQRGMRRPSRSRRSSRISIDIWCARSPPRVMRSPHTVSGTRMSAGSSAMRSGGALRARPRSLPTSRAANRPAEASSKSREWFRCS
jgi:hypothetical protein